MPKTNPPLADHLIEQYRNLVAKRYEYNYLIEHFSIDESISQKQMEQIRLYFLNYIYPDAKKRKVLNVAFKNLEKHFKNPAHLLQLLGDASGVIFKFGFQFPKALKAGVTTLNSFIAASEFEDGLVEEAIKQKLKTPLKLDEFENLIASLPEKKMRSFIKNLDGLLDSLTDSSLQKKTIGIMEELISKMKSHKNVYSKEDIDGMKIGLEILKEGFKIFAPMDKSEKRAVTNLIIEAETHFLDEIFGS